MLMLSPNAGKPHEGFDGPLKILGDRGGRADLPELVTVLRLEIKDPISLTDTAQLLGFADVDNAHITLTPVGQQWVRASPAVDEQIFAGQAHDRAPVVCTIVGTQVLVSTARAGRPAASLAGLSQVTITGLTPGGQPPSPALVDCVADLAATLFSGRDPSTRAEPDPGGLDEPGYCGLAMPGGYRQLPVAAPHPEARRSQAVGGGPVICSDQLDRIRAHPAFQLIRQASVRLS
jgi:hypothetical protein